MSSELTEFEIFKGKNFSTLCKDIVRNSEDKKNQIDILISDLRGMIKTVNDAVMIVPLLKDYYDVGIRNDEQLIKLAAIVQRILSGKATGGGVGEDALLLTDEEKKQLLEAAENSVKEMQKSIDDLNKKTDKAKAEMK
jgi:mevalonate kinase